MKLFGIKGRRLFSAAAAAALAVAVLLLPNREATAVAAKTSSAAGMSDSLTTEAPRPREDRTALLGDSLAKGVYPGFALDTLIQDLSF